MLPSECCLDMFGRAFPHLVGDGDHHGVEAHQLERDWNGGEHAPSLDQRQDALRDTRIMAILKLKKIADGGVPYTPARGGIADPIVNGIGYRSTLPRSANVFIQSSSLSCNEKVLAGRYRPSVWNWRYSKRSASGDAAVVRTGAGC